MEKKYYTIERNTQIILSVLKAYNIKRIIVSPGATNICFVGSIQNDDFFEVYSCVDERSAAYMACGMAAETGEPVVLSCTGATASRNYYPALTEAFYRKLPVLAITSHQGTDRIGHLIPQNIDRRIKPSDIVKLSVDIPMINNFRDEHYATIEINKAIIELFRRGGGPVHINLQTYYSDDFSIKELPPCRIIRHHDSTRNLPTLPQGKIAIVIGSHLTFSDEEQQIIDHFCDEYDAVVFCDHTSGYYGTHRIQSAILFTQKEYNSPLNNFALIIYIGEVWGDYTIGKVQAPELWRVSQNGEIQDVFNRMSHTVEMNEILFFKHYIKGDNIPSNITLTNSLKIEIENLRNKITDITFSNVWIASQTAPYFPDNSRVHLGILNSLRTWNFFDFPQTVKSYSNVGGFGIDGCVSSMIGASFIHPELLYYAVIGDLAFFYDLNSLGNRHIGSNIRILLINNGKGAEFRLYNHRCNAFGNDAEQYMAAAGHWGNKSSLLVKHYAEDLGFIYYSATTKEEYLEIKKIFLSPEISDKPMLVEVFTDSKDESDALKQIDYIVKSPKEENQPLPTETSFKQKLKNNIKKVIGQDNIDKLKKTFPGSNAE
jgi:2-succinyl-5-enolpyruvyl-6-hydroxy-3-cyclohexene-1-carboxylate synthase